MPEKLRKRRERLAQAARTGDERGAAKRGGGLGKRRGGVSRRAKTVFTTQLATLQEAGLPVLRSLRILENQLEEGPMKTVVGTIAEDVETGSSLSEALAKHPRAFDDLYVNMVRAGEAGGALTSVFGRLSDFMEKSEALRRKIKGALAYPIFVLVFALLLIVFIMTFVVPKFESAFAQLGGQLPAITRLLIDTSNAMVTYWYLLLGAPILILFILRMIGRTTGGRRVFDRAKLRVWLFGSISLKSQVGRFARTLGTLSSSGVPLLQSLQICSDAAGNVIIRDAVDKVGEAVREGEPLAQPMAATGIFDDIVVNMVDVGEETGELDRMLMRVADQHDLEVDTKISGLMSILEPALIVMMGLIVGFIVVALFLPLLAMQELIGK